VNGKKLTTILLCFRIVSAEIYTTIEESRDEIKAHINSALETTYGHIDQSIQVSRSHTIGHVDTRLRDMETKIVTTLKRSMTDEFAKQRRMSAPSGLPPPAYRSAEPDPMSTAVVKGSSWVSDREGIRTSLRRGSRCDRSCPCSCHTTRAYKWTLNPLPSVMGSVTLGYSCRTSRTCTKRVCRDYESVRTFHDVLVVYNFPSWIARIALSLFVSSNLDGGPQMNLRVYNRRDPVALEETLGVLQSVQAGDVDRIRCMLQEGEATIFDVWDNVGSLLAFAVLHNRTAIVRLLLQAGADPFQEQGNGASPTPIGLAFVRFISGDPHYDELTSLFPLDKYFDYAEYPLLHLVVLGVLHVDPAEALRKPEYASSIDQAAADGNAPLHLAALRGDVNATRQLLRAGANPDTPNGQGRRPLHLACRHGHYRVAALLLDAGADHSSRDIRDTTPLHHAAACPAGTKEVVEGIKRCIAMLLDRGANIHASGKWGHTPFGVAVAWGTLEVVKFFAAKGALVDYRDADGDIGLIDAIIVSRTEFAEYLLERGANYRNINNMKRGVLHHLANQGTLEMMRIFTRQRMRGVSATAKDAAGKTPLQIFNQRGRPGPDPELRKAFEELLDSVEGVVDIEEGADGGVTGLPEAGGSYNSDEQGEDDGEEEEEEEEEFFDAQEVLVSEVDCAYVGT